MPRFTHVLTHHAPVDVRSAARTSPRARAVRNSANSARSASPKLWRSVAVSASTRSRSDMRRALEETQLAERRAHPGARLLLDRHEGQTKVLLQQAQRGQRGLDRARDRKSTRLNSSHVRISYAVFCLK